MGSTALAVKGPMARPTAETVQITFRIPKGWVDEAKLISEHMSRPGFEASYTDAFRAAIAKGLEALRDEYGIESPVPPAPKSEPKPKKR